MRTILSVGLRPRHIPLGPCTPLRLNSNIFNRFAATLGIALTLPVLFAATAHAQIVGSAVPLAQNTPDKVLTGVAIPVSHYSPTQMLRLALAIRPPHMAEEEQFIQELTTRGSPNFHQFLTPEEWNARFAPSAEDEQKVVDWATSVGFTVTRRYPNRLLVDVEAPSGVIEKALGVTINNYQVGEEVDFSNDRDPVVPSSLSGIVHSISGLNSIERVHKIGARTPTPKGPDYVAGPAISAGPVSHGDGDPAKNPANRASAMMSSPTPSNSFPLDDGAADPDNIQSSEGYDYDALQVLSHCCNETGDSSGSPPESSIALVGYGNYNYSDATTFFNNYGMAWYLYSYYINGTGFPAVDGEAPLDVEYSGAMSNSYGSYLDTARIYEYEMPNSLYVTYEDAFNDIITDDYAKVVSTSYGWEENVGFSGSVATGTMHPIFNNMIGTGITLIAASGDNGASDGCSNATSVDYPSSDPDFLAAGGTQLLLDSNGIFTSETGWQGENYSGACGKNHGGSTGGRSVLFTAPYWQTSSILSPYYEWIGSTEYEVTGNTNRLVPDIALTANPDVMGEWYYSGGSWQDEGGTSIVAPELAGFFAQENSYLDYIGSKCGSGSTACSPVGLASPFIYEDALNGAPHNPFYDMTSGCSNNDVTAADNLVYFCAYKGYDLVTGWGSANMLQLAWGINWELIPAYGQPSIAFSGPATGAWYNTNQTVDWTVTDTDVSGHSPAYPPPGVSGFTQGWDSIPSDPSSEPHGGSGNSFYSGPQYSFATSGCLAFSANGCAGNSGAQGCHTVNVQAWDNQGRNATNTYGPLCYDNVPPTTVATTSGTAPTGDGWYTSPVKVTLTATDPGATAAPATGSGVKATYYEIDTGACYPPSTLGACTKYSGPFTVSAPGAHYIYSFSEDNAGNWENPSYIWVYYDNSTPSTTLALTPSSPQHNGWYNTPVSVAFSATDSNGPGVANTWWADNDFNCVPVLSQLSAYCNAYGSAFSITNNGANTLYYFSEDASDRLEPLHYVTFYLDDIPPKTSAEVIGNGVAGGYSGPVTVTLASRDNLSGVAGTFYYVNGHGPTLYTRPIVVSYSGDVTIGFFAVDWAGNIEPLHSVKFRDFPAKIVTP